MSVFLRCLGERSWGEENIPAKRINNKALALKNSTTISNGSIDSSHISKIALVDWLNFDIR